MVCKPQGALQGRGVDRSNAVRWWCHLFCEEGYGIGRWDDFFAVSAAGKVQMQAKLQCEPITSSLKRPGLRAHYQLLGRHVLYSTGCGALKETFRHDGTIAAIDGNYIQVAAAATQPDGAFVGGLCVSFPVKQTNQTQNVWRIDSGIRGVLHHSVHRVVGSHCRRSSTNGLFLGPHQDLKTGADHARLRETSG